jgi:hypothetical protein
MSAVQMAGCVPDRYGVAEYYTHFDKGWEKGAGGGEGTSGESRQAREREGARAGHPRVPGRGQAPAGGRAGDRPPARAERARIMEVGGRGEGRGGEEGKEEGGRRGGGCGPRRGAGCTSARRGVLPAEGG